MTSDANTVRNVVFSWQKACPLCGRSWVIRLLDEVESEHPVWAGTFRISQIEFDDLKRAALVIVRHTVPNTAEVKLCHVEMELGAMAAARKRLQR